MTNNALGGDEIEHSVRARACLSPPKGEPPRETGDPVAQRSATYLPRSAAIGLSTSDARARPDRRIGTTCATPSWAVSRPCCSATIASELAGPFAGLTACRLTPAGVAAVVRPACSRRRCSAACKPSAGLASCSIPGRAFSRGVGEDLLCSGRRPLAASSGARSLHRRGRARVGAARSRCRGAAALLPEAKHQPPPSDPVLAHFARMIGSKRRPTHIARRGRSMGATVRCCHPRADAISKAGVRQPDTGRAQRHENDREDVLPDMWRPG